MRRLQRGATRLGFPELHYVYERVAAAFLFRPEPKHDATVLVADFGGGTSDFLDRGSRSRAGRISAIPVGSVPWSVWPANQFDARMIDHLRCRLKIRQGSQFKSFGQTARCYRKLLSAILAMEPRVSILQDDQGKYAD